ncbi:MAG TPA: YkgJ family cysteine cluster protein [Thermoanaerobaculia bacterium]|nr:YkgJ family cysteine cluster protein [Thermoanaerobaculia bacterium]
MKRSLPVFYNCGSCPAYCCSYARIEVKPRDVERLARHFEISVEKVLSRFTKRGEDPGEIVLRHKKDEHFGTVCRFLDSETRRCTVYHARPTACREFPGAVRCGYYDFLSFERRTQEDDDYVSTTWNAS